MPFTPFHMGPGLLLKSLLRGGFSLVLFGWAQILMDLQPLFVLLRGSGQMHGFSHTLTGALLIAPVTAGSGRWLFSYALGASWFNLSQRERRWLDLHATPGWGVALASSLIGTLSHVALDAVMHADLQPFYPFATDNPALGAWSHETLHTICIVSGLAGLVLFACGRWLALRQVRAADFRRQD